jgi:uncharacterized membrane protein HdeD (DUF308 family)
MADTIFGAFVKNWWVLLLRGVVAILFGILAFAMPGLTIVTLVLLYGIYAFADGITALWVGATSRAWWLILVGLLGVVIGIYTFVFPGITAIVLLYIIAGWASARGVLEIITAIQVRKEIENEWILIIGGIFSILIGIALFVNPGAGALALVWLIGVYAFIFGILMIILAFRMRGLRSRV